MEREELAKLQEAGKQGHKVRLPLANDGGEIVGYVTEITLRAGARRVLRFPPKAHVNFDRTSLEDAHACIPLDLIEAVEVVER